MKRSWIIAALALILAIGCLCLFGGIGALSYLSVNQPPNSIASAPTPQIIRPSIQDTPVAVPTDTLKVLEKTIVPINNLLDLAKRLQNKSNIPATYIRSNQSFQVGAKQSFWVANVDTNETFMVDSTLRYVTNHVYFWIQDGVSFNQQDLKNLVETFENKIYPTDREFFGSEWTPGVDGDPHLYILYAKGLGSSIAGYFSSTDEYPPQAHKYSNAHEMFMLSADHVRLGEQFAYSVLAHEFQHMIHWYRDRNEETWMNEGFSDLASFLNGYDIGGADTLYAHNPDIQLNKWPADSKKSTPHYGASFLFLTYFLDRFGENATKALVADPANGMVSIDDVLAKSKTTDPLTGKIIGADDVFADWVIASYLHDGKVGDGRYTYHNDPNAPRPSDTEVIRSCPLSPATRDVSQYGVDYIRITCQGDYTLHFEGSSQVKVVPTNPHSGSYAFWSNRGDESDMTLTKSFNFSNYSGPLTFTYWTWYDLEKDYDYVYLEASEDGKTWQILAPPSSTEENPSGNSYGPAYNGDSDGINGGPKWIQESVDISQFAGKKIQLRFEYVTDAAVNGEGFLLDDVAIPQTGYSTDFETDDGGWQANGFVRIQNVLPQTFRLALIKEGHNTVVQKIALSGNNTIEIPLHIGGDIDKVILVVSGTTRFTYQKAGYRFSIEP